MDPNDHRAPSPAPREVTAAALALFADVCDLDADSRADFFRSRRIDPRVRAEVESLIAAESGDSFVEPNADRLLAELEGATPERLGDFRLQEILGRGGMGTVWRARQLQPDREVAIKILDRRFLPDAALRRFELEVELLGRLEHQGIARIHAAGIGREGEPPWFAMELVDGPPLLEHAAGLDRRARLALFLEVCDAVEFAHRSGVIHRDLKSANVLVSSGGRPKVLDFGVARGIDGERATEAGLTLEGHVVGTLLTMSPEQARGDGGAIGTRSDVYALGVILYQLLTERAPLELSGVPMAESLRRIAEQEPPAASTHDRSLHADLDVIAATALAKDPERRYASVAALADDVRRHLDHRPITAAPPGALDRGLRFARRHRVLVSAAALLALVLVAATAVSVAYWRDAEDERRTAQRERQAAERERDRMAQLYGFLKDTVGGLDPNLARGDEPTVREMVDRAAEELALDPPTDPGLRASMHALLGDIYGDVNALTEAERHLGQALALIDGPEAAKVDGPTFARVLGDLGRLALLRSELERADALYLRLLSLVESDLAIDRGVRAVALQGRAQNQLHDLEARLGWIEQAIEVAAATGWSGESQLRAIRAKLLHAAGRTDEARAGLEQLVREAREAQWPVQEIGVLTELSELLAEQGDPDALVHLERLVELLDGTVGPETSHVHWISTARRWQRATGEVPALALERLGRAPGDLAALPASEVHPVTWLDLARLCRAAGDTEGWRASVEGGLTPFAEVVAGQATVDELVAYPVSDLLYQRSELASAESRHGDAREAALRAAELRPRPDPGISQAVVWATGFEQGLDAASAAAEVEVARARAGGRDDVAGQVEFALGMLTLSLGEDRDAAFAALERGLGWTAEVDIESDPNIASIRLAVGSRHVDSGRFEAALTVLEPLETLPRSLGAAEEATVLGRIGTAHLGLADDDPERLATALEFFQRAVENCRERQPDSPSQLAVHLSNLATAHLRGGDQDACLALYDEAIGLCADESLLPLREALQAKREAALAPAGS